MLELLSQAKQSKIEDVRGSVNNLDRSPTEQLEQNQAIQAVVRQWLDDKLTLKESTTRAQLWEDFKYIVDSSREPGYKLYSPE
jgi:hypothetical protein